MVWPSTRPAIKREEYVRRFGITLVACAFCRHGDPPRIECDREIFVVSFGKRKVYIIRQTLFHCAVNNYRRNLARQIGNSVVANFNKARTFFFLYFSRYGERLSKSDDQRHIFRSCAQATLLSASDNYGIKRNVARNREQSDPFRAVDLRRVTGEHVDAEPRSMHVAVIHCLRRIGVKKRITRFAFLLCVARKPPVFLFPLSNHLGDLADRLYHSDLVVCIHHGNKYRVFGDRPLQRRGTHDSVRVDRKSCEPHTSHFERTCRHKYGVMFNGAYDNMRSALRVALLP